MMKNCSRAATVIVALLLAAPAFAQAPATTATPAAKTAPAKMAPAETKSAPRTEVSLECSKQADAKGLHGKERKTFRSACKKTGGKSS